MRNLWLVINQAIGRHPDKSSAIESIKVNNIHQYSSKAIANELAKYFSSVGKTYAEKIPKPETSIADYLSKINKCRNIIFLQPTDESEISNLIENLPNKTSSGPGGISNCTLKDLKQVLVKPLNIIFNQSLIEGTVPSQMKSANIIPLHKSKNRSEANNYRPISLLITISKVLEKIMYKRIYEFLTKESLIFHSQDGFRNKHSCETAMCELVGNICKGHEKDKQTLSVFLDLSKAFDTLSHEILFQKLDRYGIQGNTLEWFKSYLGDRNLRVKCRAKDCETDAILEPHDVLYGTPQGSCLGPLLFLIFTNNIHLYLDHCQCILFADDTTIYFTHHDLRYMEWCVQEDLNKISDWFRANKLSLNTSKSNFILFKKKNQLNASINLKIGHEIFPQANSIKFLGVWLDENLDWIDYTNKLLLKLKRNINLLRVS